MFAVALGLCSALAWGSADFMGGLASRRLAASSVVVVTQAAGWAYVVVVVAVRGSAPSDGTALLGAAGGGAAGAIGLLAFYRALAMGTMSIVAPIASLAAALPVLVGVLEGERPGPLQAGGMAVGAVGVVLASRERHADPGRQGDARRAVALALVAACAFGLFFLGLADAAAVDVPWALVAARTGSMALLFAYAVGGRRKVRMSRRDLPTMALIGGLDVGANGLYALATTQGLLSVVSVLGALYPVATVLLARVVLGERIERLQELGVLAALAGVALIAAQ